MKIFIQFVCLFFYANTLSAQATQEIKASLTDTGFIIKNAPFAACHAATLVELPNKKLMAAWFAGPYESSSEVCIWLTLYQNNQWSAPAIVADGIINDSLRYACWNPVLFKNKKGKLFLFYKVGKSPRDWWGMMKSSADDGKNWSAAKRLPDEFLGPVKNKPIQLKNGDVLYPSSTESKDLQQWKIHVEKSDAMQITGNIFLLIATVFMLFSQAFLSTQTIHCNCCAEANKIILCNHGQPIMEKHGNRLPRQTCKIQIPVSMLLHLKTGCSLLCTIL
jgi:hypothetical protein